jgi:hypothetical protein
MTKPYHLLRRLQTRSGWPDTIKVRFLVDLFVIFAVAGFILGTVMGGLR